MSLTENEPTVYQLTTSCTTGRNMGDLSLVYPSSINQGTPQTQWITLVWTSCFHFAKRTLFFRVPVHSARFSPGIMMSKCCLLIKPAYKPNSEAYMAGQIMHVSETCWDSEDGQPLLCLLQVAVANAGIRVRWLPGFPFFKRSQVPGIT